MYKSKAYVARPLDQVFSDIDRAAASWPEAHRIFLADGDALALPADQLLKILQKLQQTFPRLTRVSCYATPSNILRKSPEELALLRANRLTLLYLGIETGDHDLLKKITKGATQRSIKEALHKAHESQLKVSATVILGLGGKQYWEQHIDGTLEILNNAPLTYLSTLQLFLDPEVVQEFAQKYREPFQPQEDIAILHEQQRLIAGFNPPQPVIFRSNHASNALALAGNLPKDRERLLMQIDRVLQGEGGMRPWHMRRL
ncbi:MAG: radical SAM protein [Chromatiales bacterium]|nr:radical SAM protein [Chromatiales bacterium]